MFLTGFAALSVMPLLPTAAKDLDGVALYPLVAGAFVAASLLGGVFAGTWADRKGARRPLTAGLILTVLTLLVSATSTTIWQLALGRFTDGIAAGLVAVSINAAIGSSYPEHLRARALALMSACWIVPSLAGPPLAGLVAAWWSWRAVFFGLAALTLIPAVVAMFLLRGQGTRNEVARQPQNHDAPPRRPTLPVAVTVSGAAAVTQYGVSAWDMRHLACSVAGLLLLVVFAPRLLPPRTFRAGHGLPATVLSQALASGAYFTLEAFVPLMLTTVRQVPGVVTGAAFTGAALAWAGASWLQGRLHTRVPRHRLVAAGAAVLAGAMALAVLSTLPAVPAATAVASMVLAAVGMGLVAPSLTLLSLTHAPVGGQGYASGAMQISQNLGQTGVLALASALFSVVSAAAGQHASFSWTFVLLVLPATALAGLAGRTRKSAHDEHRAPTGTSGSEPRLDLNRT